MITRSYLRPPMNHTATVPVTATGHQGTMTCNIIYVTTGNANANEQIIFSPLPEYQGSIAWLFPPNISLPIRTKSTARLSCKKF